MNGWDLYTWLNSIILGVSGFLILALFLRDSYMARKNDKENRKKDKSLNIQQSIDGRIVKNIAVILRELFPP